MNKQGQLYVTLAAVIALVMAIFAVGVHADYGTTVSSSGDFVKAGTPTSDMIEVGRGECGEQPDPDGGSSCSGGCGYGTCQRTHTGNGCVCRVGP